MQRTTASITAVFGTRPEAIKLGPVVAELRGLGHNVEVVATGQHRELLFGSPAETDLKPAHELKLLSDGNVPKWLNEAQRLLEEQLAELKPAIVVVQGDTMSTLAAARAASALGLRVAHVEAGVRSHNLDDPWPEEQNRVTVTTLASWHYAPTEVARANLRTENVSDARIVVTGNTAISALARYAPTVLPDDLPENLIVVTLHRREVQTAARAAELFQAVCVLAMDRPAWRVYWPMHPAFARALGEQPPTPSNLALMTGVPYESFVRVLASAKLVITDSGGVVEEAATLGVPTIIWRAANDRPEAVEAGIAVTALPMREVLPIAVQRALRLPRVPSTCFGTPEAARQVALHLGQLV